MNEQIDREIDVREWLAFAKVDRQAADTLFEAGLYSVCALHCQQAVEKLLKEAIVAETGRRPPYEHNLWILRQQLTLDLPERIEQHLAALSPHYITSRYPVGVGVGYDETIVRQLLTLRGKCISMVYEPARLEGRIARYLALVRQHIGIDKAILFGSYAYGQPHEFSDVDVVIVSRDFCDVPYIHRLEQLSLLAWESKVGDIEALGYTPEEFEQARDLSLLGEVRERGIVVYDAAQGEA